MTSVIDNETLQALLDEWESNTERLRNRRLGPSKKAMIKERERVASVARAALPSNVAVDESLPEWATVNRYLFGEVKS